MQNMNSGDLAEYKEFPENGKGIVLQIDGDMALLFWMDEFPDYIWEKTSLLKKIE